MLYRAESTGKRAFLLCACAAAALLAAGASCKKNPSGPGGDDGPAPLVYGYTSTDTTVNVSIPLHYDTTAYCVVDTLIVEIDTVPPSYLAFSYVIAGDSLTLIRGIDTAVYSRVGGGAGLEGTWTRSFTDDGLPSGLIFAAATVTLEYCLCHADDFITYDWAPDSGSYAVTLQMLSCTQVQLTGDSTGETVTITWNAWGDMTTSGTGAGHVPHTWYVHPGLCPNDYFPDWYYSGFLSDNFIEGPLPKRAGRSRMTKRPLFR